MGSFSILFALILTTGLWLRFIRRLDRIEPEPIGALIRVGILGGLLSGIPAGECNVLFLTLSGISLHDIMPPGHAFMFSMFVGANEELCKLLATALLIGWSKRFDEPADGVVYATTVALGFAAFENLDYAMEGGLGVLLIRSVTALPLHLGLAALWGYGLARWKFIPRAGVSAVFPWYVLAALLHAGYDFILFAAPEEYSLAALFVSGALSWMLIRSMRKRLTYLVEQSPFIRAGFCASCGALNPPAEMICEYCGNPLRQDFFKPCGGCGAKLGWEMKYCPRCGTKAPLSP